MVYGDDAGFALYWDFADWAAYAAKNNTPILTTLTRLRKDANAIINRWIGSFNVDITDARFTDWLEQLEDEVIRRMRDKKVDRAKGERGLYQPHDHLYQAERDYCITIGKILGYRVPGMVG